MTAFLLTKLGKGTRLYMTCGVVVIHKPIFFNRKYPMQGTLAFGGRCYSVTLMPKSWRRYEHCEVLMVLIAIISLNVHVSLTLPLYFP